MTRETTEAVHAGRRDLDETHVPPLDRSTTHPIDDLDRATESLESLADGRGPQGDFVYQRLHNPTVARFERAVAELEGAPAAVAFASGMAAITATLPAAEEGGEVVAIRPIYGGTEELLSSGLVDLDVTWTRPEDVADAVTAETSLVLAETPANPTLDVVDIERLVERAGGAPVAIDSTFASPVLQRPLAHGAAFSIHSATKFIGGHGDLMGGVVACDEDRAARLRRVRVATGGVLAPRTAYDLHRGLQTLPARMEAAQARARALAEHLADHRCVEAVHYPGFDGEEDRTIVDRQMAGPGAIVSFELDPGRRDSDEAVRDLLDTLEVITPAVSLGSIDTLIQYPAGLTHREVDPEVRRQTGISETLLRLSVGLEAREDLWEDLRRGLEVATRSGLPRSSRTPPDD